MTPKTLGVAVLALVTLGTAAHVAHAQTAATPDPLVARAATLPPLNPTTAPQQAGSRRVTADLCTLDGEPLLATNSGRAAVDVATTSDGAVWVVDTSNRLRRYRAASGAGCTLRLDTAFGQGGMSAEFGSTAGFREVDALTADQRGHLYVTSSLRGTWRLTGVRTDYQCREAVGRVTVSADGRTGFSTNSQRVMRLAFTDTGCTATPWTYQQPFQRTERLSIVGDVVYVAGYTGSITTITTRPYGFDGTPRGDAFGRDPSFGSTAACYPEEVFACGAGLCVLDVNCRNFFTLSAQRQMSGRVHQNELFGREYPWVSGVSAQPRRPLYVAASQELGRQSRVFRGLIYRVTGL